MLEAHDITVRYGRRRVLDGVGIAVPPGTTVGLAGPSGCGKSTLARVLALLEELEEHIEREDLGIFPVSVVTLGAAGWATVERAHRDLPTFLTERTPHVSALAEGRSPGEHESPGEPGEGGHGAHRPSGRG